MLSSVEVKNICFTVKTGGNLKSAAYLDLTANGICTASGSLHVGGVLMYLMALVQSSLRLNAKFLGR